MDLDVLARVDPGGARGDAAVVAVERRAVLPSLKDVGFVDFHAADQAPEMRRLSVDEEGEEREEKKRSRDSGCHGRVFNLDCS